MSWNLEQAANDLERYVLRKEPPAIGACKVLIAHARAERTCEVSHEYVGDVFPHSILVKELTCGHEVRIPFSNGEELQGINSCPECGAKVIGSSKYEQGASSAKVVE